MITFTIDGEKCRVAQGRQSAGVLLRQAGLSPETHDLLRRLSSGQSLHTGNVVRVLEGDEYVTRRISTTVT